MDAVFDSHASISFTENGSIAESVGQPEFFVAICLKSWRQTESYLLWSRSSRA
jgi:hypothetical protein